MSLNRGTLSSPHRNVLAIQLCGLDVKEMLGLADGRLLVCGL
jgi:hypothetical protein